MSSERGPSAIGLFGTMIMILGLMWMALSGLCSALVVASALFNNEGDIVQGLTVVAVVGGVSLFIGWLIWLGGRALRRAGQGRPEI